MAIIQSTDEALMLFIQNHLRFAALDPVMMLVSILGQAGAVWIAISLLLMTRPAHRQTGLVVLVAMGLCYVFNDMLIKALVARPRPFLDIPELTILLWEPSTYSFPSGHACSSFCAAYLLVRLEGRRAWPAYVLAALIALSRPYVGVHYVSDILVGALVGTTGGIIGYKVVSWRRANKYTEA